MSAALNLRLAQKRQRLKAMSFRTKLAELGARMQLGLQMPDVEWFDTGGVCDCEGCTNRRRMAN